MELPLHRWAGHQAEIPQRRVAPEVHADHPVVLSLAFRHLGSLSVPPLAQLARYGVLLGYLSADLGELLAERGEHKLGGCH